MKLLTLFLTLLLITTNAYAEWTFYFTSVDGTVWFYDKSSVKRNGNKVKVWSYINISTNDEKAKSDNIYSQRALQEIDCVNETFKVISLQSFTKLNLGGDVKDTTLPNPTIVYIPPNSTYAVLMRLVCK